jgi:hypothetical protein
MSYINRLGLILFVLGARDFPVPDSAGVWAVIFNFVMMFGGSAMFLWVTPESEEAS